MFSLYNVHLYLSEQLETKTECLMGEALQKVYKN